MRAKGLLLLATMTLASAIGSSSPESAPGASGLAPVLRQIYAASGEPGERWRHRGPEVVLPDGTRVPRDKAYRDDPGFVTAAQELLGGSGDDPVLGAWLLGTVAEAERPSAARVLSSALRHPDLRVRLEAAQALGVAGGPSAIPPLLALAARDTPASATALWAARRLAERTGEAVEAPASASSAGLAAPFCRGVNWWFEEDKGDAGAASFRALRALGVDWVSVHTWDPLQRDVHSPEWAASRRPASIPRLREIVASAHAEGLKVMVKPHLEMRGYEPTAEEVRIFRGQDEAARQKLIARVRREAEGRPRVWHNDIEMRNEADWQAWFARYEGYVLAYARPAAAAGVDAFCIGRETDKAAAAREGDWRRLIARVREAFRGALTYSANFDGYSSIRFWDALDVIGISAYFPLTDERDPSAERLAAAWDGVMTPLEAFARKENRRVVFTEIGYPAVSSAAARPWEEAPGPADVWLQARLYESALQAVSRRPFMAGTFFWLWEGVSRPPFRDASFSIQDKPASFVMARWYGGPTPRP